ncbi:hypothetical protein BKA59DRAFT_34332 [Fusarium tricinctum]|uniref:Uncharacterized protein n=1 Tax=Fusarium tricinctum TaxID=61284 RepID=A0A8K0S7J6_9HYPO|nr:hypothetical protein BKA59DRAFT_34332 [Fusarium tricinctum]
MIMPDSKESSYFYFLWTCFASKFFFFFFYPSLFTFSLFFSSLPRLFALHLARPNARNFCILFLFYILCSRWALYTHSLFFRDGGLVT